MAYMILSESGHITIAQSMINQDMHLAWGDLPPFLGAPLGLNAVAGSGGTLTAGTYTYEITSVNPEGESTPSATVQATVATNGTVALSWGLVAGATGYNIYGRILGSLTLLKQVTSGSTVAWTDDGSLAPGATVAPASDTTSAAPWTTTVPNPNPNHTQLYRELGRRKVLTKQFVKPDPNGSIQTPQGKWSPAATPTKYIYLNVAYDLSDAASATIYQYGLFVGTVPTPDQINNYYLTPGMISNPGSLLALENTAPIIRNSSTRETHEIVLTF